MIDFKNGSVFKLHKVKNDAVGDNLTALLLPTESIIGVYKSVRDYVVFTDLRAICVNIQGVGKKQDLTSMPYKHITVFSVETSGLMDISSELTFWFSGIGEVRFEFTGESDIIRIGKIISGFAL
jgi:hypothetical protein